MLEFLVDLVENMKKLVLFIPNKINEFIIIYKELDETSKRQAGIIEAYKDKVKKIQFYADCKMYDKIKELATTPIENKF